MNWNRKAGKFEGEIAFIKDKNGNIAYKEATIALFQKSFTLEAISRKLESLNIQDEEVTVADAMVATVAHEIEHDTDPKTIETLKKRQEGESVDFYVEDPANEISRKVHNEIKNNRHD